MEPPVVAAISVVGTLVVVFGGLFLLSGGRFGLGWRVMRDPALADKVKVLINPPPPEPPKPKKPSGVPFRLLALLQREGRLLDFLLEKIDTYGDDQVGAAVRDIHRQCQAALKEHVDLEPVLRQEEGSTVD